MQEAVTLRTRMGVFLILVYYLIYINSICVEYNHFINYNNRTKNY